MQFVQRLISYGKQLGARLIGTWSSGFKPNNKQLEINKLVLNYLSAKHNNVKEQRQIVANYLREHPELIMEALDLFSVSSEACNDGMDMFIYLPEHVIPVFKKQLYQQYEKTTRNMQKEWIMVRTIGRLEGIDCLDILKHVAENGSDFGREAVLDVLDEIGSKMQGDPRYSPVGELVLWFINKDKTQTLKKYAHEIYSNWSQL